MDPLIPIGSQAPVATIPTGALAQYAHRNLEDIPEVSSNFTRVTSAARGCVVQDQLARVQTRLLDLFSEGDPDFGIRRVVNI
jgi:hypothetical protein